MLYALFFSCIVSVTGELSCAVNYTNMDDVATTKAHCLARAREMQRNAIASALYNKKDMKPALQDVYCGTREEMIVKGADKHNVLRNAGIETDFFEF